MKKWLCILALVLIPVFSLHAEKIKVLIVPGHDDKNPGTEFGGAKEVDMNVKLGLMLLDELSKDSRFDVSITRDWDGYTKEFTEYLDENSVKIEKFIVESKKNFQDNVNAGAIKEVQNILHNTASNDTATKLYGFNYWANENGVDVLIHIHFNDYPRKYVWRRGIYHGFAIYVPDNQFALAKESELLSFYVFNELRKYYEPSNYKKELGGIIPTQSLIALGSNGTLKTKSILIEYGYIYEPKFSTFAKRRVEMKRMAKLTTKGLQNYFNFFHREF